MGLEFRVCARSGCFVVEYQEEDACYVTLDIMCFVVERVPRHQVSRRVWFVVYLSHKTKCRVQFEVYLNLRSQN